MALFLISTF